MTRDKKFQMRCEQEFLDLIDSLRKELGMSRTEFIEFAVRLFPALSAQQGANNG
jgi:hypothetical protein